VVCELPTAEAARDFQLALLATQGVEGALHTAEAGAAAGGPGELSVYRWIREQIASGRPPSKDLAIPRLGPLGS